MSTTPADVERTVIDFLTRLEKLPEGFDPTTPLYAEGVGLDSLETAELSALLEDELGSDPFSTGDLPQTLAEIQTFYVGV
ncbi:phosphopantetheine-binding protein [Nocardioides alcanivorans]|uniref:phosphopantetheine-binding protein n=1 Tax=Nocardioides alcanivorans TaxID=2897352 RepID=UPI001F4916B1|nr:phosphopantetheine-binding protein [Nocardioides alcanivorans]